MERERHLLVIVLSLLLSVRPCPIGAAGPEPAELANHARLASLATLPLRDPGDLDWKKDEVEQLGRQAFLWGWPLVYLHNWGKALALLPGAGLSGGAPVAPPNQLCMLTDVISPSANLVPCASQDVIYGMSILDLGAEPVVVQIPDFGDRFWLIQLGDQRTDSFADAGHMYGTAPGFYLIVGPEWHGDLPPGFAGIWRCPTRVGFCIPRVFVLDTDEDRLAAQRVIRGIGVYPLSRFTGVPKVRDWSKVAWFPRLGTAGRNHSRWVNPEKFFEVLGDVLEDVPPLAGEEAFYARLRRVLRVAQTNPDVSSWLVRAAIEADRDVLPQLFEFRNLGRPLPNHWTTIDNGGNFQCDFLTRTAVAKSNIFVNRAHEARYFYLDLDETGARLNGRHSYRLTFPPKAMPPTRAFWSITVYDENHRLLENPPGSTSLGTRSTNLRYHDDGSLTMLIQTRQPGTSEVGNWLCAPPEEFSLYLRVYWPDTTAIASAWHPPAATVVPPKILATSR